MEKNKQNELRTRLHSRSQGFGPPKMSVLGNPILGIIVDVF